MRKPILALLFFSLTLITYCQTGEAKKLNFGFEHIKNGKPAGWDNSGSAGYALSIDSSTVKEGKYSAVIEYIEGNTDFKAWAFTIPDNYYGYRITLSGYIKTDNVTDGYAGLWMRIDPSIAFDNMNNRGVNGTTGWTKYEITLNMNPEKTKQVVVGGLLAGKGKMWIDDLKVTIDGKEIKDLKPFERKIFAAEKDKEFDTWSQISSLSLTKDLLENLKMLGLVWGFLKYYHPAISTGEYNWDYELFRVFPKILNSVNKNNRDDILVKWINSLGQFPEVKKPDTRSADIKLEPDLTWINTTNFSDELTSLLLKVKNAYRTKEHYYIGLQPVGKPEFKNENPYSSMRYPDAGYRILALYRYWNIIQYFFPYKNLIGEDWKNVLEEFIPKISNAKNETEYTLVILELIGRVHDTHANIWGGNVSVRNYFGVKNAAIELTFIENKAVVTRYHNEKLGKETGLKSGDIITTINNKTIEEIIKERLKYTPASNYATQLRNIAKNLLSTNDSIIKLEFIRNAKKEKADLKAYSPAEIYSKSQAKDTCFRIINNKIGYINNGSLKINYLPKIWEELKNTKGLIIDVRNYPSDFVLYELSNYLLPKSTPFVKFTNGSIESPGLFVYTKTINAGKKNDDYYKGTIIIIVNETTQSSAEFTLKQ
jgi:hypothetical protein